MPSTDLLAGLLFTCERELARLITAFEDAPSSSGLSGAAAVAEVLVLGEDIPFAESLQTMLSDAAARWLRLGMLEELCYARVELVYPAVLLAYLARRSASFRAQDGEVIQRLCEGRLIARSEVPVLTQRLIAAYLRRCGADVDFGEFGGRDLVKMVDKRALRARSDEYDMLVVLMCAQLLHLLGVSALERPGLYPQLLLAQAVRSANENWLPVLVFLCTRWFPAAAGLRNAALDRITEILPAPGDLLPAPRATDVDQEYIGRTGRGLRIRSTIALIFALCTSGGSLAEDLDCVAVN